ncbi:amidohydrolase family protein [Helicobacter saguini]|uniref:Amidohydrolase family protein n=2 Tax=Helicobacter saguini TaxID=1548018 RepID=A0A347VTX4_9HELI|nr:amidohydrolase family protein [Helicobacter saguini]MWV67981.1 amidohydrolase family protein [Helicobacter saguini]MWV70551.1 amidohydrolase family protein [Helicobacter saguini]MWV72455.1 amidohydrolase family protein [Helicobacter saguini]TLD94837.1 dihydroorotase [Helicobacter saguini]
MNAKTIHTLSQKALNGGVSTLFLNPYTTPAINNEAMIALLQSINNSELVNIFSLIPSTIAPENEAIKNTINSSDKLSNIDTLYALNKDFNNISSAIFCNSYIGSNLLYQAMQYAKMLNVPLCAFPFDFNIEQGVAYESAFARGLGLPMITPIGQIKEVAKIKEMAKFLDLKVILMSLNIAYCFDMVCHERNIFTQVGLPHLIFSERDIKNYDTRYKIMPPLLTRSKKEKLLKKLVEGKISLLSSMQNAVSKQFKEQVFEFAPFSVEGLEGFFSIAYTHLVRSGLITLSHLLELVSGNASDLMGLNKGRLEANRDADFMIIDLDSKYVINNPLSPYHNMEVYGILHSVVINGHICDVKNS